MKTHPGKIEQQLQLKSSYWVYSDGLSMDYEDMEELLSEPHDKIIHDMELLIRDALDNHSIYEKLLNSPAGYVLFDPHFPVMAMLFLGEIKSEGSLPLVLEVLNKDPDWNNFWISEDNLDLLWEPLIHIGKNHLDQIDEFLMDPNTSYLARSITGDALVQLALNYSSSRQEIIDIYTRQIKSYIDRAISQNSQDRDHMGIIVWKLVDLGSIESLLLIRQVFDLKLIELDVLGDFKETKKILLKNSENGSAKIIKEIMPLTDRHAWYWDNINEEFEYFDEDD